MNRITKVMTLMNFQDSYALSTRNQLFLQELNWLSTKVGLPGNALLIPYAYAGTNYPAFYTQVVNAFAQTNISITDINSGNPQTLLNAANMIVICGGSYSSLKAKMDQIVSGGFNIYAAIKARLDSCVPCICWNEGSGSVSPYLFTPPSLPAGVGINASPNQLISNYTNNQTNRNAIKTFLLANPGMAEAIAQVNAAGGDGTSVRLEESGAGILYAGTAPYPTIIHYKIVGGNLVES